MHNPSHPGEIVKIWLITDEDGNKINSVTQAAKNLNVHRSTLIRLLSGESSMSAQMALALESIGVGGAEMWLKMQMQYDLFKARQEQAA